MTEHPCCKLPQRIELVGRPRAMDGSADLRYCPPLFSLLISPPIFLDNQISSKPPIFSANRHRLLSLPIKCCRPAYFLQQSNIEYCPYAYFFRPIQPSIHPLVTVVDQRTVQFQPLPKVMVSCFIFNPHSSVLTSMNTLKLFFQFCFVTGGGSCSQEEDRQKAG